MSFRIHSDGNNYNLREFTSFQVVVGANGMSGTITQTLETSLNSVYNLDSFMLSHYFSCDGQSGGVVLRPEAYFVNRSRLALDTVTFPLSMVNESISYKVKTMLGSFKLFLEFDFYISTANFIGNLISNFAFFSNGSGKTN